MEISVILGSVLRHGLGMLGAYLVSKGYIEADTVASLVEQVTGGLMAVGVVAWSAWRSHKLQSK